MRVLVVGEAPSKFMHERGIEEPMPLAGRELANLAGVDWPTGWHERFEPTNVLNFWPGKQGKGDKFPLELARPAAVKLMEGIIQDGRTVVLLGWRVARAFGLLTNDYFEWVGIDGWRMAIAPHPSHVSHWWNSTSNKERARAFWRNVDAQGVDQDLPRQLRELPGARS